MYFALLANHIRLLETLLANHIHLLETTFAVQINVIKKNNLQLMNYDYNTIIYINTDMLLLMVYLIVEISY